MSIKRVVCAVVAAVVVVLVTPGTSSADPQRDLVVVVQVTVGLNGPWDEPFRT